MTVLRNGANLLDSHIFQFDFLNDPFSKLPKGLMDIINNEDTRRKLVIYINPPYAEAANKKTVSGNGSNKKDVAVRQLTYLKYLDKMKIAGRELFAQFIMRIYEEIPSSVLAQFSTLKIEQAPNFRYFRDIFRAKLGRNFIVPANTFDNVKGNFPIGFFIWHLDEHQLFTNTITDVYNAEGLFIKNKVLCTYDNSKTINDWIISTRNRCGEKHIGYISAKGNDFQNTNYIFIINDKCQLPHPRGSWISNLNLREICIYFAVRHCINATWLNDRDQFLYPNNGWEKDYEFQGDCLIFTLFHGQNRISSQGGKNNWIPFTEEEVNAKDKFESHFMSDYISGKYTTKDIQKDIWENDKSTNLYIPKEHFTSVALSVLTAGRNLWSYYHSLPEVNPNASFYDIRLFFQGMKTAKNGKQQMNADSQDKTYMELLQTLRKQLKQLAKQIEPKVYEYGFLKKDV